MKISIISAKKQSSNNVQVEEKAQKIKKAIEVRKQSDVELENQVEKLAAKAGVKMEAKPKKVKASSKSKKATTKEIVPSVVEDLKKESVNLVPEVSVSVEDEKKDKLSLSLVQYSEKCIAVFGDTKQIKDELKALRGRYNANLHPFGMSESVAGWVFPIKAKDDVQELVNKYTK